MGCCGSSNDDKSQALINDDNEDYGTNYKIMADNNDQKDQGNTTTTSNNNDAGQGQTDDKYKDKTNYNNFLNEAAPDDAAVEINVDELPDPLWVFGYGSICWKPGFPYEKKQVGYINGCLRRFWQENTTHRGTEEKPGLVLTIVDKDDLKKVFDKNNKENNGRIYSDEDSQAVLNETFKSDLGHKVYGVCFQVPKDKVIQVVKDLDWRERDGYIRVIQDISLVDDNDHTKTVDKVKGLLYIGLINNHRLNALPIDKCAEICANSAGPAGPNYDYVLNLDTYLKENDLPDDYISQLSQKIRDILDQQQNNNNNDNNDNTQG